MGTSRIARAPTSRRRSWRALGVVTVCAGGALSGLLLTGTLLLVETHGVSMLPTFRTGDLAVVMAHATYHVGEVVAYWSPLLHVTVLHRIVGEHGGRFTFKGDNNDFLDPLRLPASAIRGSLLLRVPDPGNWLQVVELHLRTVVIVLMGTALLTGGAGLRRPRRTASHHRRPRDVRLWLGALGTAVALPLVAAGVALAVLVVALLRPATHPVARNVELRQTVAFRYAATASSTTVYPDGVVTTGMPVFTRLVPALAVSAAYRLHLPSGHAGGGTMTLDAAFVSTGGWTRSLGSVGPVRFTGDRAVATYHLDLAQAEGLLQALSNETGIAAGSATIVLTPEVHVRALVDGMRLTRTDAPPATFALTSSELLPTGGTTSGAVPRYPELHPSTTTTLTAWTDVPSTLRFLGHAASVAEVRADALRALLATLAFALGCALIVLGRLRASEARQIRARYRRELVEVASTPELGGQPVIDVTSIAALAQIAEGGQSPLLHHGSGRVDRYYALRDAAVYRYELPGPALPPPPRAPRSRQPRSGPARSRPVRGGRGAHARGARAAS